MKCFMFSDLNKTRQRDSLLKKQIRKPVTESTLTLVLSFWMWGALDAKFVLVKKRKPLYAI